MSLDWWLMINMAKKKAADLEWYVYRYNMNSKKIEEFNIFRHIKLCEYLEKARKKYKTCEEFVEQMRKEFKFYFWSKSEYELIIEMAEDGFVYLYPWGGCKDPEECKLNVSESDDWYDFGDYHVSRQRYGHEAKIDIYDQVMWKWTEFYEYVCRELGIE